MVSKFLNISTDTTLGGNGAGDDTVASQKAIKGYVDGIAAGKINTSAIATAVSGTSTNTQVIGAKLFYDTCGDIETLINAL